MRVHFLVLVILSTLCCNSIQAQKTDSDDLINEIKLEVTNFFVNKGLLDEEKVAGNNNYILINEIAQNKVIGYNIVGVYKIGVFKTHSKHHVLLKEKNQFKILNLDDIKTALKELSLFFIKNDIDDLDVVNYTDAILQIYKDNSKELTSFKSK